MTERVVVTRLGKIAHVRLNRAEKLNALDFEMFVALRETGLSLMADRSVRAVVLSGEGRAFCAGLDISAMFSIGDEGMSLFRRDPGTPANMAQRACAIWTELPVPVIAGVHGHAYGAGLQLALGADIRIVAPDAKLSVMEIKWGLIPDLTGTQSLKHLVRLDVAKELLFTGKIVAGVEAVEIGLATRVSAQPIEDALAMADKIANKNPDAIRAGKRLLNQSGEVSRQEGLLMEADFQRTLLGTPNHLEAVQANFQKRTPEFRDAS